MISSGGRRRAPHARTLFTVSPGVVEIEAAGCRVMAQPPESREATTPRNAIALVGRPSKTFSKFVIVLPRSDRSGF
jgi:predicted protein tyrosine phosphatase